MVTSSVWGMDTAGGQLSELLADLRDAVVALRSEQQAAVLNPADLGRAGRHFASRVDPLGLSRDEADQRERSGITFGSTVFWAGFVQGDLDVESPAQIQAAIEPLSALDWGGLMSVEATRRLACDATITTVTTGALGQVLDVGRRTRTVTAPLWAALVVRDRHCAFPGCDTPTSRCDAHHIRLWADGGPTTLTNPTLCQDTP